MRRTFMDDDFLEWEAYVSAGALHSEDAARFIFICLSRPEERPRVVRHPGGDPADAERELVHMSDEDLLELFDHSEPLP